MRAMTEKAMAVCLLAVEKLEPRQTLAGMCTEVKVKYWGPHTAGPCVACIPVICTVE
jgi:hypothetical protein